MKLNIQWPKKMHETYCKDDYCECKSRNEAIDEFKRLNGDTK